jgi:hypothetical protein
MSGRVPALLLAALLVVVIAVRFAQPIEDGDIFWHMAYGHQMLDRGTLVPDHSIYSWMPASNDTIYCTWLSDLLFLGVWKAFGPAGLFALRYAAILAVSALMVAFARRRGTLERPETWLASAIVVLTSAVATYSQPEMLSLVVWNGVLPPCTRTFTAEDRIFVQTGCGIMRNDFSVQTHWSARFLRDDLQCHQRRWHRSQSWWTNGSYQFSHRNSPVCRYARGEPGRQLFDHHNSAA